LGARGLALGDVKNVRPRAAGEGDRPQGGGAGRLALGALILAPTGALFAPRPPQAEEDSHHLAFNFPVASSFAARSSAVLPSLSLSARSAPRWRRSPTVEPSPSAAAIMSAVRPRLSVTSSAAPRASRRSTTRSTAAGPTPSSWPAAHMSGVSSL